MGTRILSNRWVLGVGLALIVAVPAVPEQADTGARWWSLEPVIAPSVPEGDASTSNPIDRFIDAKLRAEGLQPVGPADKLTLLRRVYLDLIGLPPTPEEQQAFLADDSPDAYEKVVDELLANEQHAVRYARHWLDVLRYADADSRMEAASGIYLWRDWVIRALHEDVPYDDFVQIQLTGRRAEERTRMSATGYRSVREPRPGDTFALGFLARGAGEHPAELAMNAVDTISSAFLGMTVSCAKCHDHVYDPIAMTDYYSMKALFDPLVLEKVTLASAAELMEAGKAEAAREKARAPLEQALATLIDPYKQRLYEERVQMLPPEVRRIIRKPEAARSVEEQKIADDYFPILRIDDGKIDEILPEDVREQSRGLKDRLDEVNREHRVPSIPVYYKVETDPLRAREKSYVLTSGDPTRPQLENEVQPHWPFDGEEPDFRDGRVEAFADWLTAPENPLFARVAVNRMWQWHFGMGLHPQPSDFGRQGGQPSHPKLLDWLAAEFVRQDYSMKTMHRLMVTSKAYQRSSAAGLAYATSQQNDPGNTYLWRFRLKRLEAEPIWDSIHAAAGRLDLQVGGPSFNPERSRRRGRQSRSESDEDGEDAVGRQRRGVYMIRGYSASRDVTPNFLQTFDVDDGREPCPMRTQTVTSPQALFLMNSPEIEVASERLAQRLEEEAGDNLERAVERAYRLTLARPPSAEEMNHAIAFVGGNGERLKQFCWLIFNLDEFIYVR